MYNGTDSLNRASYARKVPKEELVHPIFITDIEG